jgi:hypothetical protein
MAGVLSRVVLPPARHFDAADFGASTTTRKPVMI